MPLGFTVFRDGGPKPAKGLGMQTLRRRQVPVKRGWQTDLQGAQVPKTLKPPKSLNPKLPKALKPSNPKPL